MTGTRSTQSFTTFGPGPPPDSASRTAGSSGSTLLVSPMALTRSTIAKKKSCWRNVPLPHCQASVKTAVG